MAFSGFAFSRVVQINATTWVLEYVTVTEMDKSIPIYTSECTTIQCDNKGIEPEKLCSQIFKYALKIFQIFFLIYIF